MLDSTKFGINPESFKIIEGKLYLFYDGFWGDTLKRWNKKLSKKSEANIVKLADENWNTIVSEK